MVGLHYKKKGITMSDTITIKFKNWDKYNKRQKDIKRPYWFAMSNEIFLDPFYSDLTDQEKQAFIWLLCEASRQNKYGEVEVSFRLFVLHTGYKRTTLDTTLAKLLKSGRAAGSRQDGGRIATATGQNRTEHDMTEQDRTVLASSENFSLSHPQAFAELHGLFLERGVKPEITIAWEKTYPEASWIIQEVRKAVAWETANTSRKKINFGRFMTNWLNKGWDSRRSTGSPQNYAERRFENNKNALEIALAREAAKNEK
jgi:hypothetical protein